MSGHPPHSPGTPLAAVQEFMRVMCHRRLGKMQMQQRLVYHLHVLHTLMELFKILEERKPISLAELFQLSQRSSSQAIRIPKHNLELFKHNFVYNGSHLWNGIIKKVFEKCTPSENNIMIPGSNKFSDLSMPISIFKQRLKKILIETQKMSIPGRPKEWMPHNNWAPYPPTLLPI